jgi:hypothetical protein
MQKAKHIDIWLIFDKTFVMRTLTLFLFSFLSLCPKIFAQTVFAPQGAVWHYYLDGDGHGANYKFEVEKDTTYEGKLCSKALSKGTKNATYFYTNGDTVFYYHDSIKKFTPLYIFNVKSGDSITLVAPPPYYGRYADTIRFTIERIDTVIIDGLSLRTVYTDQVDYSFFLPKYTERIGGYQGMNILCVDAIRTADHSVGIRCYSDKDIDEKFISDKWDCDYVPNNIIEKTLANDIRIYPNPANQQLFVEIAKQNARGQIQILTLDRRVMTQKEITGADNKLDLSNLSSGLYLLNVTTEEETNSRLISVIH